LIEQAAPLGAALGLAVAIGLDVYLTLLLLALAPLGAWRTPEPALLLGSPWIVATAAALYGAELIVERTRPLAVYWHIVQALARPLAAALLAHLILDPEVVGPAIRLIGPIATALVAGLVHTAKCGGGLMAWLSEDWPVRRGFLVTLEDVTAAGFVALSLDAPLVAGLLSLAFVALLAGVGGAALRAGVYGHALAWARSWGSLRGFRWLGEHELPADVVQELEKLERSLGRSLKVAPAAGFRLDASGLFRPGWLVVGAQHPHWVTRSITGCRVTALDLSGPKGMRVESVFMQVGQNPGGPSMVFPRNGPTAATLEAELRRGFESAGGWEPWEPWNDLGVNAEPPN